MSAPSHLASLIKETPKPKADEGALEKVRASARLLQAAEQRIEHLEELLKSTKAIRNDLRHKALPDLMDEAGIDHIGVPPDGNNPAFDITLKPFYSANIAADWDQKRREAGFFALEGAGAGSLIKTRVTISLPREERSRLTSLLAAIKGYAFTVEEAVHAQTLTAWVKEQHKAGATLPPLDVIGATIGRVAAIKERKE